MEPGGKPGLARRESRGNGGGRLQDREGKQGLKEEKGVGERDLEKGERATGYTAHGGNWKVKTGSQAEKERNSGEHCWMWEGSGRGVVTVGGLCPELCGLPKPWSLLPRGRAMGRHQPHGRTSVSSRVCGLLVLLLSAKLSKRLLFFFRDVL